MSTSVANQLFVAYLGRPADSAWQASTGTLLDAMNNVPSAALQTAMYNAAIVDGRFFATDSTSSLVNKIFLNTFGFAASTFEQTAWSNLVTNGTVTTSGLAWTIFKSYLGATNVPATYQLPAQSKLIAAEAYTAGLLNNSAANLAYSQLGSAAATSGVTYLTGVTSQATAASASANVATTISTGAVTTGSTFTLTTGSNVASGTYIDGSRFLSGGTFVDTLNSSDTITGTSGTTDTLFVQASNLGVVTTTAPASISAIEVLTLENYGTAAYTLSLANGDALLKTINVNNSVSGGGTVSVSNNSAALTTLALSNDATAVSVASVSSAVAGTADTLAITLNAVTGAQGISFAGYETVNLTSIGTVANAIGAITDASLTTLNIFGAQQVTLTSANTNLVTVNAGTATGKVLFTTSAVSNIAITGGTAADTFTMTGTYTTADTINGGTGTDTLVLNTAELTGATTVQSNVSSI